jgi:hypothetical protein
MSKIVWSDGVPYLVGEDAVLFEATAVADPPEAETEPPAGGNAPGEDAQPPEGQVPSERITSTKPEDVPWEEWHRRSEAVRSMAREFDEVDHGDIRDYLEGRTTRELTDEEVGQIRHDVTAQRVADITDILDEQLRSTMEQMKRGRRTVRVQAPRGWMRRAFGSLDERAVGQVVARLIDRGHDSDAIKKKVLSRVKDDEVRASLEKKLDDGHLKIEFTDTPLLSAPYSVATSAGLSQTDAMAFALHMAESIASNVKTPDINIEIPVNVGSTTKRIVRDDQGFVKEIVPDESE